MLHVYMPHLGLGVYRTCCMFLMNIFSNVHVTVHCNTLLGDTLATGCDITYCYHFFPLEFKGLLTSTKKSWCFQSESTWFCFVNNWVLPLALSALQQLKWFLTHMPSGPPATIYVYTQKKTPRIMRFHKVKGASFTLHVMFQACRWWSQTNEPTNMANSQSTGTSPILSQ